MDHRHSHGKPISILRFSESKEVIVDNIELDKIFNHPEIQDRNVVILSLIGAFRGGKSFFLDYCLRFLYAHFPSINNKTKSKSSFFKIDNNWMGSSDEPLKGFSWRSGTKRETIGINIWSDVFLHTMERTGKRIAIFVMDTQGLFDNESTPTDNSRIFALGTLISSIQVLNLKQQIQEDQLQYLQFATEFAKFNAKKKGRTDGKPFQNLTFLIRDWQNFDDYEFGPNGGKRYFEEEVLKIKPSHAPELRSVREFVRNSFEEIECCLMPYPGMDVAGSKNFDGQWSKMDEKFKIELKKVIEHLLMPEKMTLKKLNSQKLTVNEFKVYVGQYLKLFQSGEVPKTPTLYQFILDSNMSNLIKNCVDQYKSGLYESHLTCEDDIPVVHGTFKTKVLQMYDDADKMGDRFQQESFKAQLNQKLDVVYKEFKNVQEQRFKELKREKERHQKLLEEERKRKEQAERERRQKEDELKKERERTERERKARKEEREREEKRWREYQKQQARESRKMQERLEEEERKREEQAERERRQKEDELKKERERTERERKAREEEREREEKRWREYQEQQARERELQERLEEEERKRKEAEGSFVNSLWRGIKGAGLVVAAPFVVVGGTATTGVAALVGAIKGGRAEEYADEAAEEIFGGYGRAWQNL